MFFIIYVLCLSTIATPDTSRPPVKCLYMGNDSNLNDAIFRKAVRDVSGTTDIVLSTEYDFVTGDLSHTVACDGVQYAAQN